LKKAIQLLVLISLVSFSAFAQDERDEEESPELTQPPGPTHVAQPVDNRVIKDMTWNGSLSFGGYRQQTYNEISGGVSLWFEKWFSWKNEVFFRSVKPANYFGLDSSGLFHFQPDPEAVPFSVYGGPGFRLTTGAGGNSAPFFEAGVSALFVPVVTFNLGIKTVLQSLVDKALPDDTQMVLFSISWPKPGN
jgi:hypothetical protein